MWNELWWISAGIKWCSEEELNEARDDSIEIHSMKTELHLDLCFPLPSLPTALNSLILSNNKTAATATTSTAAHQEVFSCIFEIPSTYSWQMLMFIRIKSLYTAEQAESSRIKAHGIKNSSSIKIDHDIKQYSKSNSCYTFEQS